MRKLLMASAVMLFATPAFATLWNVDPAASKLTFTGEQSGDAFTGSFPKFSSSIDFDEAKPEAASIHIVITMADAQVDGKDRQDALPTDDWFGVKKFPVAEFTSTSVKKTGDHQFAATGNLNIRGVMKEVTLPFTLKTAGKATVATGNVAISRKDFAIGQGRWASDEWIKYPVKVSFEIHATAQ
jgi:polyisoprenoid-binding protein YceI